MPKHPHEYVIHQKGSSDETFFRFVMTIRRHGYDDHFYLLRIRYLDLDGRRYWTMGEPRCITLSFCGSGRQALGPFDLSR